PLSWPHRLLSFLNWRSSRPPRSNIIVGSGNCRTANAPRQQIHARKLTGERLAAPHGHGRFDAAYPGRAYDVSVENTSRRIPCKIWRERLPESLHNGERDDCDR